MQVIAHRGLSAHYPENTILAYQKALDINVSGIEVDLHQVDNEFVLYHDFKLDKLTDIRADICDQSLKALREIRFDHGQKIPLLSELFALVQGKCMLNLELKAINSPALLVKQIVNYVYQYNGDIVISSFNHHLLNEIQTLIRDTRIQYKIRFGGLVGHLPIDLATYAVNLHADIAAIDLEMVTIDFVKQAHQYNLEVWCYTINHEKDYRRLKKMGVDAIFTNDPALMQTLEAAED